MERMFLCGYLPGIWKSTCWNILTLLFNKMLIRQSGCSAANRSRCSLDCWTSKVLWNNCHSGDGGLKTDPICSMLPSVVFLVHVGVDNCKLLRKQKCQVELLLSLLMKVTICRNGTLNCTYMKYMKYAYVCMFIIYIKAMAREPVRV